MNKTLGQFQWCLNQPRIKILFCSEVEGEIEYVVVPGPPIWRWPHGISVQWLFIASYHLRLFLQVQVSLLQQPQASAGPCIVSFDALRYWLTVLSRRVRVRAVISKWSEGLRISEWHFQLCYHSDISMAVWGMKVHKRSYNHTKLCRVHFITEILLC